MNVDTGITSEVFTIKSETKLIDIFNEIINKKSDACLNYINNLNLDKNTKIVVVGTYFTGVGIVKKLSEEYENIFGKRNVSEEDLFLYTIYELQQELMNNKEISKRVRKVKDGKS